MPVAKTKSTKSSGKRRAVKARDFALDARERKIQQGVRGKYLGYYERWTANNPIVSKTKTYHEGANDERTAILAKVRREKEKCKGPSVKVDGMYSALVHIEQWLLTRNERYKKNPGGL